MGVLGLIISALDEPPKYLLEKNSRYSKTWESLTLCQ